jgi:hypothetical protein
MIKNDEDIVAKLALQYHSSTGGVQAALNALRSSGGRMAQLNHPDFGGMAQWSRGMTMVGDMFNSEMKAKLNAICSDFATYLAQSPENEHSSEPSDKSDRDTDVSYRSHSNSRSSW